MQYKVNYGAALPSFRDIRVMTPPLPQQKRISRVIPRNDSLLTNPYPPVLPPVKRVMKSRHPFDIYHDQYEALRELALEDRKRGGIGSMSAMVREAIDNYVAEKRKEK